MALLAFRKFIALKKSNLALQTRTFARCCFHQNFHFAQEAVLCVGLDLFRDVQGLQGLVVDHRLSSRNLGHSHCQLKDSRHLTPVREQ